MIFLWIRAQNDERNLMIYYLTMVHIKSQWARQNYIILVLFNLFLIFNYFYEIRGTYTGVNSCIFVSVTERKFLIYNFPIVTLSFPYLPNDFSANPDFLYIFNILKNRGIVFIPYFCYNEVLRGPCIV